MYDHEEFLWTGLRGRLERMGKVRPRTIRPDAVGQLPERTHPQVFFHAARPALREQIRAAQPARAR